MKEYRREMLADVRRPTGRWSTVGSVWCACIPLKRGRLHVALRATHMKRSRPRSLGQQRQGRLIREAWKRTGQVIGHCGNHRDVYNSASGDGRAVP